MNDVLALTAAAAFASLCGVVVSVGRTIRTIRKVRADGHSKAEETADEQFREILRDTLDHILQVTKPISSERQRESVSELAEASRSWLLREPVRTEELSVLMRQHEHIVRVYYQTDEILLVVVKFPRSLERLASEHREALEPQERERDQ